MTLPTPSIEYFLLCPTLIVFGVAVAGVLVEAFVSRRFRYGAQVTLALGGLVAAFVALLLVADTIWAGRPAVLGAVAVGGGLDSFTPQASAVPGSDAEREAQRAGAAQTELFPLVMLSVGGMMVFPASNDLLTMFVALEVLSLPLYLMCGLARHRRLQSQEAAMKYFLLGAFSSAFFLYGVALLYGATGTL